LRYKSGSLPPRLYYRIIPILSKDYLAAQIFR
jgi:hypothetical protein